jgi:hypothetical protein
MMLPDGQLGTLADLDPRVVGHGDHRRRVLGRTDALVSFEREHVARLERHGPVVRDVEQLAVDRLDADQPARFDREEIRLDGEPDQGQEHDRRSGHAPAHGRRPAPRRDLPREGGRAPRRAPFLERPAAGHALAQVVFEQQMTGARQPAREIVREHRLEIVAALDPPRPGQLDALRVQLAAQPLPYPVRGRLFDGTLRSLVADLVERPVQYPIQLVVSMARHRSSPASRVWGRIASRTCRRARWRITATVERELPSMRAIS